MREWTTRCATFALDQFAHLGPKKAGAALHEAVRQIKMTQSSPRDMASTSGVAVLAAEKLLSRPRASSLPEGAAACAGVSKSEPLPAAACAPGCWLLPTQMVSCWQAAGVTEGGDNLDADRD